MIIPRERSAVAPQPITLKTMLLVEGETPAHFFEAIAARMGVSNDLEIRSYGGINELPKFLRLIASTEGFKANVLRLGITRDAENDVAAARKSVREAMQKAQLSDRVKVKVFILPDDVHAGMLETLCLQAVAGSPIIKCVDEFFACVTQGGIPIPSGHVAAKHRAQAYLSAQLDLVPFVGIAAKKGLWPLEAATFDVLKAYLTDLCADK